MIVVEFGFMLDAAIR